MSEPPVTEITEEELERRIQREVDKRVLDQQEIGKGMGVPLSSASAMAGFPVESSDLAPQNLKETLWSIFDKESAMTFLTPREMIYVAHLQNQILIAFKLELSEVLDVLQGELHSFLRTHRSLLGRERDAQTISRTKQEITEIKGRGRSLGLLSKLMGEEKT